MDWWHAVRAVLAASLIVLGAASVAASQQPPSRTERATTLLDELIGTYGVSGDEGRVRAVVLKHLPAWATPEVDSAGNVWVRVGAGKPTSVFVAHMDETGFQITSIRDDGLLDLRTLGGVLPWLWESTPALVHTPSGPVPGVFTPRAAEAASTRRGGGFRVDVGASSRTEVEAMGVRAGQGVTNPKRFVRLAGQRATGRSFDDRVGTAAQLLALQDLDPKLLKHEVIFLWVVEEETGLIGSGVAAKRLGFDADRVYAIDTFVSSDSPLDPQNFANTPIGRGPVARVVDNSSVTPPAVLDTLVSLARRKGIPLQVGTTNGGNDGSAFSAWGVMDIPIGWPLRYSHSPVEVIDLRDVPALADLLRAIATDW